MLRTGICKGLFCVSAALLAVLLASPHGSPVEFDIKCGQNKDGTSETICEGKENCKWTGFKKETQNGIKKYKCLFFGKVQCLEISGVDSHKICETREECGFERGFSSGTACYIVRKEGTTQQKEGKTTDHPMNGKEDKRFQNVKSGVPNSGSDVRSVIILVIIQVICHFC